MNKNQHFDDNRAEILEKGVANKILEQLNRLKMNSTKESSRRWIWELIQNAKDAANVEGNINIHILYDKENKELCFRHNGALFTDKSILYLIEQVSSKEQGNSDDGATGKFGTGFLTTHLLSEKANVSGILKDDKDGVLKSFSVDLDRSGYTAREIIDANYLSNSQLKQSLVVVDQTLFDYNDLNTSFKYSLDSKGIDVADAGLKDFYHAIVYVFAFVPELSSVSINNDRWLFARVNQSEIGNGIFQTNIKQVIDGESTTRSIITYSRDDIDIALEVGGENQLQILKYHNTLPKIFCDFPLIGTSDFPLPFLVNSHKFNPTEPRDGIFLKSIEHPDAIENKQLLTKAIEIYNELLEIISGDNWKQIYHITEVSSIPNKTWIPEDWLNKNIIEKVKAAILEKDIIDPYVGDRCALYDWLDNPQVYIINEKDEAIREKMWELIKWQRPDKLTRQEEIHNWYHSLWKGCRNYSLKDLVSWVEEKKNITTLIKDSSEGFDYYQWANSFIELIENDQRLFSRIVEDNMKIFPNQLGEFCGFNELFSDKISDEIYKEILKDAGVECRHKLLDLDIILIHKNELYGNKEICEEIEEAIENDITIELNAYKKIIRLHKDVTNLDDEQIVLIGLLDDLNELATSELIPVKVLLNDLYSKSKKELFKHTVHIVSEYKSLEVLGSKIEKQPNEWIGNFIDSLKKFNYASLLELKKYPILPNQHGLFLPIEELFLDDGEIDSILKDIAAEEGNDIRNELLLIEICIKLPESRRRGVVDIAQSVISYVKKRQTEKVFDEQVKANFRALFLWITDNESKAREHFDELYKNKHWLYDDEEIATNIRKAEEYDSLLTEYSVSSKEELEVILRDYHKEEATEVTEEILVQAGIFDKENLEIALTNNVFGDHFKHDIDHDNSDKYQYAMELQERATERIFKYLDSHEDYDVSEPIPIDKTVYIIKKKNKEMYLIIRPSDYDKVILYYNTEYDVLDFEKDWELWVEDENRFPERITFGKMLKLTGINKIPLKRVVYR